MQRRMARKQHFSLGYSTARAVLDILLDFGENVRLFDSPYKRMKRSWRKIRGMPEPVWKRYERAIKYLESRGQIKAIEKNNQTFIRLTREGKVRALLLRLVRDFGKAPRWDGKWRVIIWDIPESYRHYRDQIRGLIKDLGFYQLQQSVFITPYPLPPSAVEYLKESELLKYLRFLRVDRMENDTDLRKHFGLPNG